jgi:uncharacterized protein YkvS
MEDATFKKDETPYLIFECTKCKQFMYVKTTQKGKKCLRCGRTHAVSKILDIGEIVNGMTTAVEEVKNRQNAIAISELGHEPELRAFDDFKVIGISPQNNEFNPSATNKDQEEDISQRFKIMLKKLSSIYKTFPSYVLEVMADNYMIPHSQLKLLKKQFQNNGILKQLTNNKYTINL